MPRTSFYSFLCALVVATSSNVSARAQQSLQNPDSPLAVYREASAAVTWNALLDQAEPLYLVGDYKGALPLYVHAVAEAQSAGAADRIKCLRYLADCYCRLQKPDEAYAQYEKVDALISSDDLKNRIENLNEKAVCAGMKAEFDKGESLCRSALQLCNEKKGELVWTLARTKAHLGYFDYMRRKYASAISSFQEAEQIMGESDQSDLTKLIFGHKLAFAQAGSYYHLRRFDKAYEQFKRLYDADAQLFGKMDLQTGWAMLALSDVLEKLNRRDESQDYYRKAIYVFRKVNSDRLYKQHVTQSSSPDELRKRIDSLVFGKSSIPADLQDAQQPLLKDSSMVVNNHDPRSFYVRPFTDAPGLVWLNPAVKQVGIVVALHGLSLEHSSYDALGKELADAGFCTVAFDVRGFGVYRQALGAEQLDFDSCMRDLQLLVGAIRGDSPGVPLFMLGESMGGAIAVQFAARNPQLVDGLVASVPAGKRFKQGSMTLKVALHFLDNKHRPFDVGIDVINQATHDPQLKQAWRSDPKTRNLLSPHELITFQSMCDRNIEHARRITATPVIMFQGVSDGLVKPEATYDLFRAVASKDKSLVMVGNAEHLIFEEGCFSQAVLKGLVAWMEAHAAN